MEKYFEMRYYACIIYALVILMIFLIAIIKTIADKIYYRKIHKKVSKMIKKK